MVLPKNGSPLSAQAVVFGYSTKVNIKNAWALPPGTPPIVAWLQGDSVLADLRAWFDSAVYE